MSALRIAHPGAPAVLVPEQDPDQGLTHYQRRVMQVLRSHNGNRCRTAREIGTTVQSVQSTVRVMRAAGARVPTAPRTRAGCPNLRRLV